jgi:hypothetical protein
MSRRLALAAAAFLAVLAASPSFAEPPVSGNPVPTQPLILTSMF